MKELHYTSFLKTVTSAKQIHDHPLNNSTAKPQYSFSISNRFADRIFRSPCQTGFYALKDDFFRSKRSCSLGIGTKFDFTKICKDSPAPNTYYPKNYAIGFEERRGYSFGLSRDHMPHNGALANAKLLAFVPGPGAYTPQIPKSDKTVTFRIKAGTSRKDLSVTGPGKYNVPSSFEPSKIIHNSKYPTTKSTKFAPLPLSDKENTNRNESSPTKSAREGSRSLSPALAYDTKYQLNAQGVFFNSKYKNSMCRTFSKSQQEWLRRNNGVPGPGFYQVPSDFGIYESSKINNN